MKAHRGQAAWSSLPQLKPAGQQKWQSAQVPLGLRNAFQVTAHCAALLPTHPHGPGGRKFGLSRVSKRSRSLGLREFCPQSRPLLSQASPIRKATTSQAPLLRHVPFLFAPYHGKGTHGGGGAAVPPWQWCEGTTWWWEQRHVSQCSKHFTLRITKPIYF